MKRPSPFIAAYLAFGLTLIATPIHAAPISVTVTVDRSAPVSTSDFSTGTVIAQHCLDDWFDPDANASGRTIIAHSCRYACVAIMGWGAGNPEPSPGQYDWASLDKKIALVRSIRATPVITLCGAPDWMKGGQAGQTDWKRLEVAPLPEHEDDFAALCAAVAKRYPDVRYYQVWNEFKGLWSPQLHDWDVERYTRLYNKVYTALKGVDSGLKIGGPYLVIEGDGTDPAAWYGGDPLTDRQKKLLEYWLSHKLGADFLVLDRGVIDFHDRNTSLTVGQKMALTPLAGAIVSQAKQLPGMDGMPVWFAEFYGDGSLSYEQNAVMLASLYAQLAEHGASAEFEWQCQDTSPPSWKHALFTSTDVSAANGGGQPLPLATVTQVFHDHFGPGTPLYAATSSDPARVEAIASDRVTYLINKSEDDCSVTLDGRPYEVEVLPYTCLLVSL